MTPGVAGILEGLPEPRDLRLDHVDGRCLVTGGRLLPFAYDGVDVVMRTVAICSLRQLGFAGGRVAAVFGLTENYVATLHSAALREGWAALVRRPAPGRPGRLGGGDWEQAAAWRAQGVSDAEIGRRLGVANTTVGRRLGPRPGVPRPGPAQPPLPEPGPGPGLVPAEGSAGQPAAPGPAAGTQLACRNAGAMLLHAFGGRAGAGAVLAAATGGPSGLAVPLPLALAELKKAAPAGARIMLGFDRGGAYAQVFAHCREQNVDWVSYRRAPLAVPAGLPVITTISVNGRKREVAWAGEMVTIKDYGQARQITLFERGQAALQILTSDARACPPEILAWLKSRWREENFLKYASENYGIDAICDYFAEIAVNTKVIDNPARKAAVAAVRQAEKALAAAREDLAVVLADPAIPASAKNARLIPAAQQKISRSGKTLTAAKAARDKVPAKLPASEIDPDARVALLRTGRRGLQMVLRLLAHNAEHWLSVHLNAYLRDDDEYRAITRETIIRGLAGTITHAPDAITVRLETPMPPRVARALALLLDEISAQPLSMPGDTRPITYQLAARQSAFNSCPPAASGD